MRQFVLYSTSHCHLCEQAEKLLINLQHEYEFQWDIIEISNDAGLIDQYGIRIPVIKCINTNAELNWPFTQNDMMKLIQS